MFSRILIVDDNVSLTTLLSKALIRFDYETVVENNSSFALDTARRVRPNLILLDVMMPELDGGEVLRALRNDAQLRLIPVILLTALAREAKGLANQGGIESVVLSKPVEIQVLLSEIRKHLAVEQNQPVNDTQAPQPQNPAGGRPAFNPFSSFFANFDPPIAPMEGPQPQANGNAFGGPDPLMMKSKSDFNPFGSSPNGDQKGLATSMPALQQPDQNPFARTATTQDSKETLSRESLQEIKPAKEVTLPR